MASPLFLVTEGVGDLVNRPRAPGQQALHREFGGGLQVLSAAVDSGLDGLDMWIGVAGGIEQRRIHFQKATLVKKGPDTLQ